MNAKAVDRRPDSYHTCYTLCGLSTVEHSHSHGSSTSERPFASAFTWEVSQAGIPSETDASRVFESGAKVKEVHPIYIIPHEAALAMTEWFLRKPLDAQTHSGS